MHAYNHFTITLPPELPYPVIVGTWEMFAIPTPLTSETFEGSRTTLREMLETQAGLKSPISRRAAAILERFESLYAFPPTPVQVLQSREIVLTELLSSYRTGEPSKVYLNEGLVVSLDDGADRGTLRVDMLARGGVQLGFTPDAEGKVEALLLSVGFRGPFNTWGGKGSATFSVRVPSRQLPKLLRATAWLNSRIL